MKRISRDNMADYLIEIATKDITDEKVKLEIIRTIRELDTKAFLDTLKSSDCWSLKEGTVKWGRR